MSGYADRPQYPRIPGPSRRVAVLHSSPRKQWFPPTISPHELGVPGRDIHFEITAISQPDGFKVRSWHETVNRARIDQEEPFPRVFSGSAGFRITTVTSVRPESKGILR